MQFSVNMVNFHSHVLFHVLIFSDCQYMITTVCLPLYTFNFISSLRYIVRIIYHVMFSLLLLYLRNAFGAHRVVFQFNYVSYQLLFAL